MAHATFVKKARKNIYENGKMRKYKSKKGKNKGKMLETLDVTIPENKKDKILIKAGESYWWWQFKNCDKSYSKTQPKASQLTRSGYLSTLYSIQESMDNIECNEPEDLESIVEDIKSELENLKDETESSLENMPEHLQESSSSGELLRERVDALENAISEFDSLDLEYQDETDEDATEEERDEAKREWIDEKISEISGISLE